MAWITLTSDHVRDRLAFDEINAIEATGGGDGDRLSGILTQVTSLVRAKVAACDDNSIGDAGTIPEECLHAAATLAKHDLRATLPSTGLEDEGNLRADEYRAAQDFLSEVASCNIGIENPDGESIGGRESGCYGGDPILKF